MPKEDTQFKKGQSGNPNGRPPGVKNFTTKVKEALEALADGSADTNEKILIKTIIKRAAVDGDVGMIRTVWEQLDGKPLQRTELSGTDGSPLKIEVVKYADDTNSTQLPAESIPTATAESD